MASERRTSPQDCGFDEQSSFAMVLVDGNYDSVAVEHGLVEHAYGQPVNGPGGMYETRTNKQQPVNTGEVQPNVPPISPS